MVLGATVGLLVRYYWRALRVNPHPLPGLVTVTFPQGVFVYAHCMTIVAFIYGMLILLHIGGLQNRKDYTIFCNGHIGS